MNIRSVGALASFVCGCAVAPANLNAEVLFSDAFDSGSVTDPSARATGSLASGIKYAFSNNTGGAVAIVSGVLDWVGANNSSGDLVTANSGQRWTFVDSGGVAYDWSSKLAGNAYDIRFTMHTAWSHPLTFGLSDNVQGGNWNADASANYDFAFGAYGNNWQTGDDGVSQNVSASVGNAVFEVSIRVNEIAGTVDVYVDDALVTTRSIDFENSGRYFSFGEPTKYGGYIDNFAVTVVDPDGARITGNWSEATTWYNNSVPGTTTATEELDLIIPEGVTVTLDTDVEIGTLFVRGGLTAASSTVSMVADSVIVEGANAAFALGSPTSRYAGDFTLTLKGEKTETYTAPRHIESMGARALLAHDGAVLSLHGEDRVEWTRLASTADVGATSIVVDGQVDWRVGDEIVIAPSRRTWDEFDLVTVASASYDAVSDTTTVNFQSGQSLVYWHLGEVQQYTRPAGVNPLRTWTADLRAEVALLTRNITIQGDVDSLVELGPNDGFGAHIMVHGPMDHMGMTMPTGEAYVESVALKRMGQKQVKGRYPFHWHLALDSSKGGTVQQYFRDSAIHKSFNRAITIHGTDYALVDNNVAYDYTGHGVFFEDGAERFNVVTNNLIMRGERPVGGEELLFSEFVSEPQNRGPAAYWITNPNNTIENNVAAGSQGTGFWFAMPTSPLGPSGVNAYFSGLEPHKEPLGSFVGNSTHSVSNGFDIFDQVQDDPAQDLVKNLGWDNADLHIFQDFTAYACAEAIYCGLSVGGPDSNNIFDNAVLVDNEHALFLAANMEVRNSVIKAGSDYQLSNMERGLWRYYDGPGRVIDTHMMGFNNEAEHVVRNNGGATTFPNTYLEGVTTDHAEPLNFKKDSFSLNADPKSYSTIFYDSDGLVTQSGSARSIVPDHPFMTTGDEVRPAGWENYVYTTHRYVNFYAYVSGDGMAPASMTRTKTGTPDGYSYGPAQVHHHQFPVIVNEDYLYTFQLETLPTQRRIYIRSFTHNIPAYAYTVCYKNFGQLPGIAVNNANLPNAPVAVASIAAVNASTVPAYYIESNGDVYVKHVEDGTYRLDWTSDPTNWVVMDNDGDGVSDTDEAALDLNPNDASDSLAHFDTDGDFGQWDSFALITGQTVSGSILSGTSTGDAKIRSNGLSLDTTEVSTILIRYKASLSTTVQMFWSGTNGGVSGARVVNVNYNTPGSWATLVFDMSSHASWTGETTGLRLDPIQTAGSFEIDWIKFSDGDRDNDGLADAAEGYGDFDSDGFEDFDDVDSDSDTLLDNLDPDNNPADFALMRETWLGMGSGGVSAIPVTTAPDYIDYLGSFATAVGQGDNYGERISGYVVPPVTGNYTFWIAGDNGCELWLTSTGDTTDPNGAQLIASVNGFTTFAQWDKYTSQQSVTLSLVAGQAYYIEALHFEATGGDHVAVAWSGPGITQEIIDGAYLLPYVPAASGSAHLERWEGITGALISSIPLTTEADYEAEISLLDLASEGDSYGQRIRGYLHPTVSGDYTFWVAGDDRCELWLSTDESESNKTLISYANGFTGNNQWAKYATQTSSPVSLVAGQRYYLEVLHEESGGGDHVAAAWELNSNPSAISPQVIEGRYLSPWQRTGYSSADIGGPALDGSASYDLVADAWAIEASGADIWGTSDQFNFVYKELAGDVSITVKLDSLTNTHAWAKAGVMVRQSLNGNSANAALLLTPSNGMTFQRRATAGGTSASEAVTGVSAPGWLRLTRVGDVFTAEHSLDGTSWTQVGSAQTVSMTGSVYVGLSVTSHTNASLTEATFSELSIQTDN